jgi:hypothetical protein
MPATISIDRTYLAVGVQRIQQAVNLVTGKAAFIHAYPKPTDPLWVVYATEMTSESFSADSEQQTWTVFAEYFDPDETTPTPSPEYVPPVYTDITAALWYLKSHSTLILEEGQEGVPYLIECRTELEYMHPNKKPQMVLRCELVFDIPFVVEWT